MQQPRRRTSYPPPPPMSYPRPLYHRYEARHTHAPRHYRAPPPPQASPGWATTTSHAPRELVGVPYPDPPREGEWVLSLEQVGRWYRAAFMSLTSYFSTVLSHASLSFSCLSSVEGTCLISLPSLPISLPPSLPPPSFRRMPSSSSSKVSIRGIRTSTSRHGWRSGWEGGREGGREGERTSAQPHPCTCSRLPVPQLRGPEPLP
jgi:hypothetical protein